MESSDVDGAPQSAKSSVAPWVQTARAASRKMIYVSAVLLFACSFLIPLLTRGVPPFFRYVIIAVFFGALLLGVGGIALRVVVLIVGYSQFSLRGMLGCVVTLAAGGAFLANGFQWVGLLLIGAVLLTLLWMLLMADNQAG